MSYGLGRPADSSASPGERVLAFHAGGDTPLASGPPQPTGTRALAQGSVLYDCVPHESSASNTTNPTNLLYHFIVFMSIPSGKTLREKYWRRIRLTIIVLFVIVFLFIFILLFLSFGPFDKKPDTMIWGVTFSWPYAKSLGLNWQEAYLATLDDLGVRYIRIPAYWNEIEPWEGDWRFEALDWQIDEAEKRDAKIILSIGRRLPRWPECHAPLWAKQLSEAEQQEKILVMLRTVIERYKNRSSIISWQIENEPFFPHFGICPEPDEEFFKREIDLVKSLDPRPIIVSDTGELSTWWTSTKYADIFGTTMYRIVPHPDKTCCFTYLFPAWWYRKHANVLSHFRKFDKLMVVELQTESWASQKFITEMTLEEAYQFMSPEQFRKNVQYARDSRIPEVYLWGAEWWRWLALQGHPEIWGEARKLFRE